MKNVAIVWDTGVALEVLKPEGEAEAAYPKFSQDGCKYFGDCKVRDFTRG